MRIIFMGNPEFAVPCLKCLAQSDHHVTAVMTNPPKKMGRDNKERRSQIDAAACELNIPVIHAGLLNSIDLIDQLTELNPDLFAIVAYRVLPKELLLIPSIGSVNLHGSLLPAYRGAAPIQRAIMNGDKVTGLTTFLLKPSVDTGDILYQEKVTIHPDDTYGTLSERMSQIGSSLLLKTINNLMEKSITPVKQDNSIATQAPKIQSAERIINWNDNAVNITNKVRGLNPKPVAHTTLNGKWIKIFHASLINENYQLTPGTIIERTKMGLLIQTGEGGLFIHSLQKEGKKRMDIQEFLQGASIKEGDQLGT